MQDKQVLQVHLQFNLNSFTRKRKQQLEISRLMNMVTFGLLMSLLYLMNIICETESGSCYKHRCSFQETIGCRNLMSDLTISQDDCCHGNGHGYYLESKEMGNGCYKCHQCSEYIGRIVGAWSSWSGWTNCPKECKAGTRKRSRRCDNPIPLGFGKHCEGDDEEFEECSLYQCPVNGQWGEWRTWGACLAKDCKDLKKGGIQTRSRSCDNPKPKFEGEMCKGSFFEKRLCTGPFDNCRVNGGWSSWSAWNCIDCQAIERTRNCTNPVPEMGGKECQGASFQFHENGDNLFMTHCFEGCKSIEVEQRTKEPESSVPITGNGDDYYGKKISDEDDDYGIEE